MSHELRTPLNSILILAKHLSENGTAHLDADEVESASVIHESGSQLLSLINDILDLSRIEAGKLQMEAEDFPVADLLTYLRRLFGPLAEKRSIGFTIDAGEADPGLIHSDRRHLIQVLTNLVSNAIKFTDKGSVRVVVEAGSEEVCFHVVDSGIGIPPDKIEHIFGAFQQVDGSIARKYGGSGLGLTISRQLVELLDGHISVESAPGQGSRFSVRLPRVAVLGKPAASPTSSAILSAVALEPKPPISAAAATPRTAVLVVEDDKRLLPIIRRLLEALGYKVTTATSAEEALAQVAVEPPAAMLLDLGLPGMSGMELLGRLKADVATAAIPVCIMSGAPDAGEARTLGAAGYIRKPITRDAVSTALQLMLNTAPAAGKSGAAAPTPRLLLVEDDDAGALAVRVLFKQVDIEISRVRDGAEGLAALKSTAFNAVILDLNLPDMSGFEWLERIVGEMPGYPPVVVYSARDLDNAELLRLRAYADAVVSKGSLTGQTSARLREEVLLALAARRRSPSLHLSAPKTAKDRERHGRLLVVDDDVRSQSAMSKVLRARGFDVTVAASGPLALTLLESASFNVILSDIMMPGMDGFEFIRQSRLTGAKVTPIIAVTAKAMPGDIESCLAAGANDYLAKPVDIDRLLALLDHWL
jgi:CheY-like chemotaxis protein/two-component sensor histidine kinase